MALEADRGFGNHLHPDHHLASDLGGIGTANLESHDSGDRVERGRIEPVGAERFQAVGLSIEVIAMIPVTSIGIRMWRPFALSPERESIWMM